MTDGVMYIAFGARYVAEAVYSAATLRRFSPNLPIALFTDTPVEGGHFDHVRLIEASHMRAKVDYIDQSPFERTLYIDSDTRIVRDVSDLFAVLDRFDVAGVQDHSRKQARWSQHLPEYRDIPYGFSEINGGVLLFGKSPVVTQFFELWRMFFYRYREVTSGWDQATLRIALWRSSVRFHTLPIEYNVRNAAIRLRMRKRQRHGLEAPDVLQPRILHWHGLNLKKPWWTRFTAKYRAVVY